MERARITEQQCQQYMVTNVGIMPWHVTRIADSLLRKHDPPVVSPALERRVGGAANGEMPFKDVVLCSTRDTQPRHQVSLCGAEHQCRTGTKQVVQALGLVATRDWQSGCVTPPASSPLLCLLLLRPLRPGAVEG